MPYKLVNRQAPTDLDDGPQQQSKVVEFNVSRPWPQKLKGQTFGPALINRSMKAGFYVLAWVDEVPVERRIADVRRKDGALQVLVAEGWRFPLSLRTVSPRDLRGVRL